MYRDIVPGGGDTATPINIVHRIDLVERVAPLAGLKILDCGCGAGGYLKELAGRGGDVWGIEYNAGKVAQCLAAGGDPKRVQVGSVEALPFADAAFDLVFMNEVIDHVACEAAALAEVRRVLKPGGVLALFAPNRFYPFETHGCRFKAGNREISHLLPFIPWIPLAIGMRFLKYYARNYWPWELRAKIAAAGLTVIAQEFVWQTFENKSGHSPLFLQHAGAVLRRLALTLERFPLLKRFGVSALVFARKP